MAEFSVKTNAVRTTVDAEERLKRELENIQQSIREISGGLAIKTAAAPGLKRRLSRLAERVEGHRESMDSMKNALENAMGLYEKTEQNICGYTGGGIRAEAKTGVTRSSFWDRLANLYGKIVGKIGEIVGGLFSHITTVWSELAAFFAGAIGNGDVTDEQPTADWADQVIAGGVDGATSGNEVSSGTTTGEMTASGAPRYKQPDYTQKNLAPDKNGIYGPFVYRRDGTLGRVYEWNKSGQLSCTYYTLRKLNERGLSYPCISDSDGRGPGNGGEWYNHFDTESGLPHFGGNNALRDLADTLSLPQENVVVSFASGPTLTDGTIPGHVLLIDEIYRDENGIVKVKYSDMVPNINSLNGSNPQVEKTLEDFISGYNRSNGNIKGVVVVGAGN